MKSILILSGTNRPRSSALKIAALVQSLYRAEDTPAEIFSLCDLPLSMFEPAAYDRRPPEFEPIQQRVLESGGLHIITPEYTGSFPGVLKYFIDLLKYPESLDRRPIAMIGESDGSWGALRAVEQLQLIFAYRNAHVYPERVFITGVKKKLDPAGNVTDPELRERLQKQVRGFAQYVLSLTM